MPPQNVPTTWTWENGQPAFSVEQAAVFVNNLDGTFGAPVRVPSTKTVMSDVKMLSDVAQGDTAITAIASQILSADLTIDFSGITFTAYQILTGVAPTASSTPTRSYLTYANDRMPYFGLVLEALAAEGAGDLCLLFPKCKITTGFSWKFDFGKIITPSIKAMAIKDLVLGYTVQVLERAALAQLTIPLP